MAGFSGLDAKRYSGFLYQGGKIDGGYLANGSVKQAQISTDVLYSGSVAPTGKAVVMNAVYFDYDGAKIYVGTNSGSWKALV